MIQHCFRFVAFATLFAFASSPSPAQAPAPRGTIVTANMTSASASIVDIATGATLSTDSTPVGPHEIAVSNDGRWAVVSWYGRGGTDIGNALIVLDVTGAAKPRRIDLGTYTRPHGMKFLPGDKQIIVTSETTQRLLLVDFASGKVDSAIATGFPASHMVVITPDARWAFTTNITPGTVSRIDLRAKKLDTSFTVGTRIEGIAITPDGKEVWVGGNTSKTVYVLDAATGAVRGTIEGFGMPYRLGVTADGKTAVVSDPGAEKIHLVDVATRRIRATLDMTTAVEGMATPSPQGVILSRDGATAFVTLKGAGKVAVVDIATAKVLKLLTVGGGSDGVGFSPLVRSAPPPPKPMSGMESHHAASSGWKELDQFHELLAATWHPVGMGDFKPVKEKAAKLAEAAKAWADSKVPEKCDKKPVRDAVAASVTGSRTVADLVAKQAPDSAVKSAMKTLHDSFEAAEQNCAAK